MQAILSGRNSRRKQTEINYQFILENDFSGKDRHTILTFFCTLELSYGRKLRRKQIERIYHVCGKIFFVSTSTCYYGRKLRRKQTEEDYENVCENGFSCKGQKFNTKTKPSNLFDILSFLIRFSTLFNCRTEETQQIERRMEIKQYKKNEKLTHR
ncbi:unnamed protein product [Acanthosepion pharaonis]|uniref:Uncharacterized protein n=1 Tax=Acanthosepion pharaonis TaxID=158019 RepID=A0A812BJP5_ACAPH|nr:unnamed protein product [Sepia pharaonis]